MELIETPNKSKNTHWVEDFLTRHLTSGSSSSQTELNKNNDTNQSVTVQDFEIDRFEPGTDDLHPVLSDIYSLKVSYKLVDNSIEEKKISHFIVKIPPTNSEDRQLATLSNVTQREINFYTQVIPTIQNWCNKKGITMQLGVAQCYHAKFDRPLEDSVVEGLVENLSKAESTIVLEDLRQQGYTKRHFSEALTLQEVKESLVQISKIHAYTWAIQKLSGEPLRELWPFYYKPEYAVMLYEALLEDGFPLLEKHLKEIFDLNKDFDTPKILQHLKTLQRNSLRTSLINLLSPSQEPLPSCLCHMDFWSDNILFRPNQSGPEKLDMDCRILDWQMFSIGKPTNDIALLLFTSLPSKIRKEQSQPLLEFYLGVFKSITDKFNLTLPFDLSSLQEEYKKSQLLALLQIIASVDLALHDDTTQERLLDTLQDLILENII